MILRLLDRWRKICSVHFQVNSGSVHWCCLSLNAWSFALGSVCQTRSHLFWALASHKGEQTWKILVISYKIWTNYLLDFFSQPLRGWLGIFFCRSGEGLCSILRGWGGPIVCSWTEPKVKEPNVARQNKICFFSDTFPELVKFSVFFLLLLKTLWIITGRDSRRCPFRLFWARLDKRIGASIQFIFRGPGERCWRHSVTRCDILQKAAKMDISLLSCVFFAPNVPIYHSPCSLGWILQRSLSHHLELVARGKEAGHLVALPAFCPHRAMPPVERKRERRGGDHDPSPGRHFKPYKIVVTIYQY